MKSIKLTIHKAPEVNDNLIGTIKITPQAESIIKQLKRETGLSGRYIVSQIIIQAADMIEMETVDGGLDE